MLSCNIHEIHVNSQININNLNYPLNYFYNFGRCAIRGAHAQQFIGFALVLAAFVLSACSPTSLIKRSLGDELAKQGQTQEEDAGLAREASAFYLKLSESLLADTPDNLKLAEAVGAGLSQYSYAYVAFEAERLAAKDAQGAYRINERAKRLYLRAHRHAMRALELSSPGFGAKLAHADAKQWPLISQDQVGLAYWAAASWGGYISLYKDAPDAVADFPLAYRLATLAWKANPKSDPVARLDASALQDRLLGPALQVKDPRTDPRLDFVGGIHGTKVLEEKVNSGQAAAAFSLPAVSMSQILAVADADQIMPPKSTWFEPKLRSGFYVHQFGPTRP
jgi:hypothetical protein